VVQIANTFAYLWRMHGPQKPIILQVGKMTAVNHPCIVRCFGMLEPTPGIVLELVDGGSLFQIIHARRDESFSQYEQRLPWPVRKPNESLCRIIDQPPPSARITPLSGRFDLPEPEASPPGPYHAPFRAI
jgi:hypothetical protein